MGEFDGYCEGECGVGECEGKFGEGDVDGEDDGSNEGLSVGAEVNG